MGKKPRVPIDTDQSSRALPVGSYNIDILALSHLSILL